MKIKILQSIADAIINTIQNMPDSPSRDHMFVFGAKLNAYAIVFHNTYLN